MNRDHMLERLRDAREPWDVVVIGGGATGLGCALDAASRGLKTVVLERSDFAGGTSSRSTKLMHGGVRYLRSGHFGLVAQSLGEREIVRRNAPGLVRELSFVIPVYRRGERAYYGTGLGLYEWLARRGGARGSRASVLSREETMARVPTLQARSLRGGVVYHDDQFDDARFALELARAATGLGAVAVNYARVSGFLRHAGRVAGVAAVDEETGAAMEIPSRAVVNAGGVFADAVRRLDDPAAVPMLRASRGAHVVVDRSFLPGDDAVMVPRTDDGRVVFLIPWRGRVLIGTTDNATDDVVADPSPTGAEVDFLIAHAGRYLANAPSRADVRSAFAGLRPLLAGRQARTASIARDHRVVVSPSGLVTVTGGKWTTYRRMAEDAITRALEAAGLPRVSARTARLPIGDGAVTESAIERCVLNSGTRGAESDPRNHPRVALLQEEAARFTRDEMARRVDDVLARRTRALFLDARAAAALAPPVAEAMAGVLGRDAAWVARQVAEFQARADTYVPDLD
jgi:glycerol-3-phosphate dehydrogenase